MFERFSDPARRLVVQAQEEARVLQHGQIGTEHLLLAAAEPTSTALPPSQLPSSGLAKRALESALREAQSLAVGYIGTVHVVLGLTDVREGLAFETLVRQGVDIEQLRSPAQVLVREAPESLGAGSGATPERADAPARAIRASPVGAPPLAEIHVPFGPPPEDCDESRWLAPTGVQCPPPKARCRFSSKWS